MDVLHNPFPSTPSYSDKKNLIKDVTHHEHFWMLLHIGCISLFMGCLVESVHLSPLELEVM